MTRHIFQNPDVTAEVQIEVMENGKVWLLDPFGEVIVVIPADKFAVIVREWNATQAGEQEE